MIRRTRPRRTRLRLLLSAGILAFAVIGLTGCRGVTDRVTAAELHTPGSLSMRHGCAQRCNGEFRAATTAEQARHVAAVRACHKDARCHQDEARRHAQNVRRLIDARQRCKRSCYNEGGGGFGP